MVISKYLETWYNSVVSSQIGNDRRAFLFLYAHSNLPFQNTKNQQSDTVTLVRISSIQDALQPPSIDSRRKPHHCENPPQTSPFARSCAQYIYQSPQQKFQGVGAIHKRSLLISLPSAKHLTPSIVSKARNKIVINSKAN